jgi:2',3'-cyclic-nucleotide 2'-phosphodiesterase (5'-nucleotidase family)
MFKTFFKKNYFIAAFFSFLLFFALYLNAESTSKPYASLLYFNDAHVIYPLVDKLGERGGVARLKTVVDEIKKDNPNSLLLFGGDLAGGLLFGAVYKGFPMVEAMNLIPVDYANFGQHDFDFGLSNTMQLVEKSKFQWISSNLEYNKKQFPNTLPYVIKNVAGIKIGIIGLIDSLDTSTPIKGLKQTDLDTAAKTAITAMKKDNPDFIIAITQTDSKTDEQLLKENPQIGAIFTEERIENESVIKYIGNRPIISPCGNIGSLIRLNVYKDNNNISTNLKAYAIDKNVKSDPELYKLEEKYRKKLNDDLGKQVAVLETPLDAGFNSDSKARFKETNIGDLLADAYRDYYKANIGFMNGGGIRANAEKGPFTIKAALAIVPFGNIICKYQCTGKTIFEALEYGVSGVERFKGSFLQVSGLKYTYNPKAAPGHRIISVEFNNKPIDMNKNYTVAMPSFIFNGGDGFTMFKGSKVLVQDNDGTKDINILLDFCKRLKNINYKTDGRITINSE